MIPLWEAECSAIVSASLLLALGQGAEDKDLVHRAGTMQAKFQGLDRPWALDPAE